MKRLAISIPAPVLLLPPALAPTHACRRLLARIVVVALLSGFVSGLANPAVAAGQNTSEGEAILAALEHVAEMKWGQGGTVMVRGQAAVKHAGEDPLSESTRGFLDEAFESRGWRWSTEDPVVPTGCGFPSGDCRLKNPTEVHLTFSVVPPSAEGGCAEQQPGGSTPPHFCWEPAPGEERYGIHVEWLSTLRLWRGGTLAELGGEGLLVTRGTDGWEVDIQMLWIT